MNNREYLTSYFKRELGELDSEDREVLEDAIEFNEISDKIARLF